MAGCQPPNAFEGLGGNDELLHISEYDNWTISDIEIPAAEHETTNEVFGSSMHPASSGRLRNSNALGSVETNPLGEPSHGRMDISKYLYRALLMTFQFLYNLLSISLLTLFFLNNLPDFGHQTKIVLLSLHRAQPRMLLLQTRSLD